MFLFAGISAGASGQAKLRAVFTPSEIGKDEYTTLRIIIENATDIRSVTPPKFKDLDLVSGPQQEFGESTVDNVVSRYAAVSYILHPRRSGTIVLSPATAIIDGKKHSTGSIKLSVSKKGSGRATAPNPFAMLNPMQREQPREAFNDFILKKGEHVADKVNRNMHMITETNKKSCYVGEPIVASYKLYTRLKNESRLAKNPSFNGFSVVDLQRPDETGYAREKLNGKEYNVYTIRKAQLYPLQDGNIELEPATLDNRIRFLKEDVSNLNENIDGFLNDVFLGADAIITEVVSLTSKPVTIVVKPLPEAGKPGFFNGAVGAFGISATLEKNNFAQDETGKLYLVISGRGNLQLVTAPEIKWPQQLEVFEPQVTDQLEMASVPVSGRKVFEIPFTVPAPGNYTVPAIAFAYFDPTTESYQVVHTAAIPFTVSMGSGKPNYTLDTIVHAPPKSFSQQMGENRGWVVGSIGLLIALGLFVWVRHDKKQHRNLAVAPVVEAEAAEENQTNNILASLAAAAPQNPLSLSEDCLQSEDCRAFYTLLNQEFKTFLAAKFSIGAQELTAKSVTYQMDKAAIDNELALKTQQLLQDIEWQLYTPFERNDAMHDYYARCQEVVQSIQTSYHPVTP